MHFDAPSAAPECPPRRHPSVGCIRQHRQRGWRPIGAAQILQPRSGGSFLRWFSECFQLTAAASFVNGNWLHTECQKRSGVAQASCWRLPSRLPLLMTSPEAWYLPAGWTGALDGAEHLPTVGSSRTAWRQFKFGRSDHSAGQIFHGHRHVDFKAVRVPVSMSASAKRCPFRTPPATRSRARISFITCPLT